MHEKRVFFCLFLVICGYSLEYNEQEIKNELLDYLNSLTESKEVPSALRHRIVTWLHKTNENLQLIQNKQGEAYWNFQTNLTSENKKRVSDMDREASLISQNILDEAKAVDSSVLDQSQKRILRFIRLYGDSRDPDKVEQVSNIRSEMVTIYNNGKMCTKEHAHNCLFLNVMADSRKPEVLLRAWKEWRDVTGPKIKPLYETFVTLRNEGAMENNYSDFGAYWREEMFDQTPDFEAMCERLWLEVRPLYLQLHAYVRMMLTKKYGVTVVGTSGTIPAHLLGNMWAQDWSSIFDIVVPSSVQTQMVTMESSLESELKRNHDVLGLYRLAEEFFTSVSLYQMTDCFWRNSMLEEPEGRQVVCDPSAFDMYNKHDFRYIDVMILLKAALYKIAFLSFGYLIDKWRWQVFSGDINKNEYNRRFWEMRIKMCTEVTMEYLRAVHHEMGHVQYFMAYENQPTVFRDSPNSAFHEAVGDTMALSALSLKHLETLGLLGPQYNNDQKVDVMILLKAALYKIAFLPFGYLIDKWRWQVFSGDINKNEYNRRFWEMRLKYQGVVSPVPRSEQHFDPAAKYHIPNNSPYMNYFISTIAQFQFYESLCEASGHTGPLHQCDFYRSQEAGSKFKKMLNMGKRVPWQQALFKLTGSQHISAGSIKKYFEPLSQWLTKQLNGETLGWDQAKINWKD